MAIRKMIGSHQRADAAVAKGVGWEMNSVLDLENKGDPEPRE